MEDDDSTSSEYFEDVPQDIICQTCGALLHVDQLDGPNDTGLVDIYFCNNC